MASRLNENQTNEDQKDFIDPATAATFAGSALWFSFKAIAQSVIGWIGLNLFLKWREKWKNRGKDDKGDPPTVSTEESAESS